MASKTWSKIVQEHGVKIRLFERSGTIYRDVTLGRTISANGKARGGTPSGSPWRVALFIRGATQWFPGRPVSRIPSPSGTL